MEHVVSGMEIVIYFVLACLSIIGVAALILSGYGATVAMALAACFILALIDYFRLTKGEA